MASGALEQSALEAKDREQLVAIASALGVKSASRAKKQELIDMILEQTKPAAPAPKAEAPKSTSRQSDAPALGADGEPLADWEIELAEHEGTPIAPEAKRQGDQQRNNDRGERNNDRGDRQHRQGFQREGFDGDRNNRNNRNRNRNRNRRRGRGDEGPQGNDRYELMESETNEPISTEPVEIGRAHV